MYIQGKLIEKFDKQQVTDTFAKREFVIQMDKEVSGNIYYEFIKCQLTQDRCNLIEDKQIGNLLKVSINLRGSKYTSKKDGSVGYITNLEALKVEVLDATKENDKASATPAKETESDLPF
jgi:hypothetical protein